MSENFSNYENKSENGSNSNIADNSREQSIETGTTGHRNSKNSDKLSIDVNKLKFTDSQYDKQLERVIHQYTPNTS